MQVNSTLDGFAFDHDCTGLARPFEVGFAGSNLTFLNGNIGYMRAPRHTRAHAAAAANREWKLMALCLQRYRVSQLSSYGLHASLRKGLNSGCAACDNLYVHGPVDFDFQTDQLPITQVHSQLAVFVLLNSQPAHCCLAALKLHSICRCTGCQDAGHR